MPGAMTIVMDREKVSLDLLLTADPSLPHAVMTLNSCHPFAGIVDGHTVAVCLLDQKEHFYDVVNLAVDVNHQGHGYAREILIHVMDFVRSRGGRYIETGCGNAHIQLFSLYQTLGFRVTGVWPDFYLYDGRTVTIENQICNRDMVRFRIDLYERTMQTTGSDASGRT